MSHPFRFLWLICYLMPCFVFAQTPKEARNPFVGIWLNERYLLDIQKNKSPYKAQKLVSLSSMFLAYNPLKYNTMGWHFHEWEPIFLQKNGTQYEVWHENPRQKWCNISLLDDHRVQAGKEVFVKLKTKDANKILEEVLFQGTYTLHTQEITFLPNGEVKGLEGFHYYFPQTDYYGGGYPFDQIVFARTKDVTKGQKFTFVFTQEELDVYEIECTRYEGQDCAEAKQGKLKYSFKFVRK